jgi:DNA polymerase III delta subunit
MLYVFHGTNTHKVADQTNKLITSLRTKRPLVEIFSFEGGEIQDSDLDALIEAQGLFVEKHIVVLRQTFEFAESRERVLVRLKRLAETQNIFVISENKLLAEHKKALTKHATKIEEHMQVVEEKKKFNVFQLGDALGARHRQELWSGYIQALRAGLEPESIHGTLHWALKSMLSATKTKSAEEAGQKSGFVYNKFKRYATNFKKDELAELSRSLVTVYHDARRGKVDFKTALEQWVLKI